MTRAPGSPCAERGFHTSWLALLVKRSEHLYASDMHRYRSATLTPDRPRRRLVTVAREHTSSYETGPTDPRPPAPRSGRARIVTAWAGPDVPSLAQVEGWYGSPPAGPAITYTQLRDEVDGDGLDGARLDVAHDAPARDAGGRRPAGQSATGAAASTGMALRTQVRGLQDQARRLLGAVSDAPLGGGELGALADLAALADTVQATMVVMTGRIESGMLAQQRTGLPLVDLLGLATRMTLPERRALVRTAAQLEEFPALTSAMQAGLVGAGEARAVLGACRRLDLDGRSEINELFVDETKLAHQPVDDVIDEVVGRSAQIASRKADDDRVKAFERRFLAIQPGLDGTLSGYLELDDDAGTRLLRALDDAAVPLTGPRALTRDATLAEQQVETDRRTLGRRRADALVTIAEHWLAGRTDPAQSCDGGDGGGSGGSDGSDGDMNAASRPKRSHRARPLMYVWTDIATLVGDDMSAAAARLLWDTLGPNPVLTPTAVRRLASDARLQFILTDGSEVLGVAAPVSTIPAKVRAAVRARDQGCRFPGCRVPIAQTDLHHVVGRAAEGHTTVDNLVAICRRHHTAITEARWILTMTSDGRVKVRRGRHTATSDPPAILRL
jgi:hypothetical protein